MTQDSKEYMRKELKRMGCVGKIDHSSEEAKEAVALVARMIRVAAPVQGRTRRSVADCYRTGGGSGLLRRDTRSV